MNRALARSVAVLVVIVAAWSFLKGRRAPVLAQANIRSENSPAASSSGAAKTLSDGIIDSAETRRSSLPPVKLTPDEERRASLIIDGFQKHLREIERKKTHILYAINLGSAEKHSAVVAAIANPTTEDFSDASDYLSQIFSNEPSEAVRISAQARAWSVYTKFNSFPTAYRGVIVNRSPGGVLTYTEMNIENERGISVDESTGAVTLSSPKASSSRTGPIEGPENRYPYLLEAAGTAVAGSH